jgi:hypothetical protein
LKTYIHEIAGEDGKAYLDKLHDFATGRHNDAQARLKGDRDAARTGMGKPKEEIELTGINGEPIAYRFVVSRASDREENDLT